MAKSQDALLTLDDLTAYLKLSKSSLYKLCQAGKVPGTNVGRHWRFHRDAIDAWVRDGVPPTQAYGSPQPGEQGNKGRS